MKSFIAVGILLFAASAFGQQGRNSQGTTHNRFDQSDLNITVSPNYQGEATSNGWGRVQANTFGPAPGPQVLLNPFCSQPAGKSVRVESPDGFLWVLYGTLGNGVRIFGVYADQDAVEYAASTIRDPRIDLFKIKVPFNQVPEHRVK